MPKLCKNPEHIERRGDGRCVACLKTSQRRYYAANGPKTKRRAKAWAERNPKQRQATLRKYNYGDQVDTIRPCPELCELCNKRVAICFDHDHDTGKFRGWLCYGCNNGLGLLGDNLAALFKAVGYLLSA